LKIAIITDQHFGCRKNSKLFHDYFLEFYDNIFFPTLEKEGITTVIDMGDTFDNRTGINFSALDWAKKNYYDRLEKMGVDVYTIVGNHTAYYKNTNKVNAIELLLKEYDNVHAVPEYQEFKFDNIQIAMIPWINSDNYETTKSNIDRSKCSIAMGHLELVGFSVNRFTVMEHGYPKSMFSKFNKVFSGHYHHRSSQDNIHYLGNPYEIYWNDVKYDERDDRGFHIFDTETLEHTPVNNPYRIFYNIYYEDNDHQLLKSSDYKDKIVKVVVRKKTDSKKFEKFVDKLYESGVYDLKVVESYDNTSESWYNKKDFEANESEDTLSILNRYIEESEFQMDKSIVQKIMDLTYKEACEMV